MPELQEQGINLDENENLDEINEPVEEVDGEEQDIDTESDDEQTEEDGNEEETDEDEDEEVPFDEWLTQYGEFPEGIKSEDDLAKAYSESLKEMKRVQSSAGNLEQLDQILRQQGYPNGVQSLMRGETPQKQEFGREQISPPDVNKSYFTKTPMTQYVEEMAKTGRYEGESLASARGTASAIDSAIGPELEKFEKVYSVMANNLTSLTKQVRDLKWAAIPKDLKNKVQRQQVDGLLEKGLFDDYESAIKYALFNNPNSLKEFAEKAEKAGEQKGRKRLRKNKSLRKGKSEVKSGGTKYNYGKYMGADGNWDERKLNTLPLETQTKMLEAFAKENKIDL